MILKYLCHMRGKAVLEILVIILYLDVNLYYIAIDTYIYNKDKLEEYSTIQV